MRTYIYQDKIEQCEKGTCMGHKSLKCKREKIKLKRQLKKISWEIRIYLKWEHGKKEKKKKQKRRQDEIKKFSITYK